MEKNFLRTLLGSVLLHDPLVAHPTSINQLIENAPTCYRAPRWPDSEFPQINTEKKTLSWAHALLKGAIIADSQKIQEIIPRQGRKSHNSDSLYLWDFLPWIMFLKGIFFLFMNFLPWIMRRSSWNEYRRWAHLNYPPAEILGGSRLPDLKLLSPCSVPSASA